MAGKIFWWMIGVPAAVYIIRTALLWVLIGITWVCEKVRRSAGKPAFCLYCTRKTLKLWY